MKTRAIITIDTEVRIRNRGLPDAFEVDVLGQIGAQAYGAHWIADLLTSHDLPGVFFLDVFGSTLFGQPRYRELCDRLLGAGHSAELHTHPDQAYDLKRLHMHEYSLEEQIQILRDGVALLKQWTGELPCAHRAGRYGANQDTLKALKTIGIDLDSSFFYGRADCKLNFTRTNAPFVSDGIWELPVTAVAEPITKLGFRLPFCTRALWARYQKLDVNCMTPVQLCRSVLEVCGTVPYVILFMHSFSFIRREAVGAVPDEGAIASLKAMLQLLSSRTIEVITFQQAREELRAELPASAAV